MTFDSPPPGAGPWRCPYCRRQTEASYRCSNRDTCGKDLVDDSLSVMPANPTDTGGFA